MARVQLNVWVDEDARGRIKALAAERGVSVGQLVSEAVLGAPVSVEAESSAKALEALELAREAERAVENLDRRLGRLEEMAGL